MNRLPLARRTRNVCVPSALLALKDGNGNRRFRWSVAGGLLALAGPAVDQTGEFDLP